MACLALCGALLVAVPAQAHLMAAQKGTLNLVGDAAFLVLSVPVSALQGVDDDGDGGLSPTELQAHMASIRTQVMAGVQLQGPNATLPLQLVMLDLTPPENAAVQPARQLVVMGRFALLPSPTQAEGLPLTLRFSLFGTAAAEQQQDFTITRQKTTQWLRLVPGHNAQALLPSAGALLADYLRLGATHVLGGADHLLFLLVVLAAGWHWRALLGALSCFTAGHALTLVISLWAGWQAPAAIVEPAIAATIVAMAAFDAWGRWRRQAARPAVRWALVFVCALIHGLGLAGALAELTSWDTGSPQMAWALLGFNLGIEAVQLGVAALVGVMLWALRWRVGPAVPRVAQALGSVLAIGMGGWWMVLRMAQGA